MPAESGNRSRNDLGSPERQSLQAKSEGFSGGIRDPLNPQAYMMDLASRMGSSGDKSLLLKGMNTAGPGPSRIGVVPPNAKTGGKTPLPSREQVRQTEPRAAKQQQVNGPKEKKIPAGFSPPVSYGVLPEDGTIKRIPGGPNGSRPRQKPSESDFVKIDGVTVSFVAPPKPSAPAGAGGGQGPLKCIPPVSYGLAPEQGRTGTIPSSPNASSTWRKPSASDFVKVDGVTVSYVAPSPARRTDDAANRQMVASSAPTMWNGLSHKNRAAQKALEEMNAERALPERDPSGAVAAAAAGKSSVGARGRAGTQGTQAAQVAQVTPPVPNVLRTGTIEERLLAAKPGLSLWTEPSPANFAATVGLPGLEVGPLRAEEDVPWSLEADLDKYRAHAVKEGSRDSGESLQKALQRAGFALEDGANVFVLGYGSPRAEPFRGNDGKGILDDPGRVPAQAGATVGEVGDGLYSVFDLIALDSLPNPEKAVYEDNNAVVRPLVFTGRAIGGAWKTTEEIGNALTWGYFDNVTGCIGLCIESILEAVKHTGEAVTNLARGPVQLITGKSEETDRALDWVLLVPLEFVSNSIEMKGIVNMQEYEKAFAEKGVIGSVLEFGGSTFLVYRTVDELIDELEDDGHRRSDSAEAAAEEPSDPPLPPEEPPSTPTGGWDLVWVWNGDSAMSDLVWHP